MSADLDSAALSFEVLRLRPVFTIAAIRYRVQRQKWRSWSESCCVCTVKRSNEMVRA